MPNGVCNVTKDPGGLPVMPQNPREIAHTIATVMNPHYGLHAVVTGRDGKLYHKYQIPGQGGGVNANFTSWKCLTPDLSKVPCSIAPKCNGYDSNPAIALQPGTGSLVVFARQMDDLAPHEIHLTKAADPESWSSIRGPACLCNFPPCKNYKGTNQTKCGVNADCDNLGVDCDKSPSTLPTYWNVQAVFPTSEMTLLPVKDKLHLYFRGFDGAYYLTEATKAGDINTKYGSPERFDTIME